MIWLVVIGLAMVCFALLVWGLRAPRPGWEAIGAALVLALAGYAYQGQPQLAGAPHDAAAAANDEGAFYVAERQKLAGADVLRSNLLITGDGLVHQGDYRGGADVLGAAVMQAPEDGEAWLALGNALVGAAQGLLTPAARYAFARAAALEPNAPGPAFFLGLAQAESGELAEARATWAAALARPATKVSPANAPWRAELASRLARLDSLIAQARAQGGA